MAVSSVVLFAANVVQRSVVVQSAVVPFVSSAIVQFAVVLSGLIAVGSFALFGNVPNSKINNKQ